MVEYEEILQSIRDSTKQIQIGLSAMHQDSPMNSLCNAISVVESIVAQMEYLYAALPSEKRTAFSVFAEEERKATRHMVDQRLRRDLGDSFRRSLDHVFGMQAE